MKKLSKSMEDVAIDKIVEQDLTDTRKLNVRKTLLVSLIFFGFEKGKSVLPIVPLKIKFPEKRLLFISIAEQPGVCPGKKWNFTLIPSKSNSSFVFLFLNGTVKNIPRKALIIQYCGPW